ncbi:hypothetical protein F5X96DRAFT_632000 [Biscogniauxia mediterranea]|nr:hypothetical protein F5X96DRAFT_632000 [Biscogniauxia mediterranea]
MELLYRFPFACDALEEQAYMITTYLQERRLHYYRQRVMKWKVASTYNPSFKTTRAIAMHSQSHTPAAHKIRSACDICHKAKMKCSRGKPCVACSRSGNECRYSVSNRLGRPPKGTTAATARSEKMIDLSGTNKEQANQPTVMASDLFGGDTSQGEDLLTLDDMFMDTFSDSSYTHSGPETPPDHVFPIMGETMNDISLMKVCHYFFGSLLLWGLQEQGTAVYI